MRDPRFLQPRRTPVNTEPQGPHVGNPKTFHTVTYLGRPRYSSNPT
jgi:hypothetical protein